MDLDNKLFGVILSTRQEIRERGIRENVMTLKQFVMLPQSIRLEVLLSSQDGKVIVAVQSDYEDRYWRVYFADGSYGQYPHNALCDYSLVEPVTLEVSSAGFLEMWWKAQQ